MTLDHEKFELADKFLRWLDVDEKQIPAPIRVLLKQLESAWLQQKIDEVGSFCQLAKNLLKTQQALPDSQGNHLYTEGLLEAYQGAMYWAQGEFYGAEESLHRSVQRFIESGIGAFNTSVVYMALGELMECLTELEEARDAYYRSLHYLKQWLSLKLRPLKYRHLYKEIEEKLERVCEKICHDSPGDPDTDTSTTSSHNSKSTARGAQELIVFPIVSLVSAGAPVLPSTEFEGEATIDTITIEGAIYNIHPLKTGKGFRLRFHRDYCVSLVRGNSMNRANIQNGDYVLLERPSDNNLPDPKDGDIVLANTSDGEYDGEPGVILKKYCKKGEEFWLEPESSEDGYEARQVSPGDVKAIAIAVLKQVSDRDNAPS